MNYNANNLKVVLNNLKKQSPTMYDALTQPFNDPGMYYDGDSPLTYGYGEDIIELMTRGYDPNLIVQTAMNEPRIFDDITDKDRILSNIRNVASMARFNEPVDGIFPSDNFDYDWRPNIENVNDWLASKNIPAYNSAQILQTIANLSKNGGVK